MPDVVRNPPNHREPLRQRDNDRGEAALQESATEFYQGD